MTHNFLFAVVVYVQPADVYIKPSLALRCVLPHILAVEGKDSDWRGRRSVILPSPVTCSAGGEEGKTGERRKNERKWWRGGFVSGARSSLKMENDCEQSGWKCTRKIEKAESSCICEEGMSDSTRQLADWLRLSIK